MRRGRTNGRWATSATRAVFALLLALAFLPACADEPPPPAPRDTIVVLWWEGVPPELMPGGEAASAAATPTLTALAGAARVAEYRPSSDRSETRLATVLVEDGAVPSPAGLLDWGARRVPEGRLSRALREAGYRRAAAVSRTELACLDAQFDVFAAPPADAASSGMAHDAAFAALLPDLDRALASDDPVFLLVATDVLARRDAPAAAQLAPHLAARIAPLAQDDAELVDAIDRLTANPADAAEALREKWNRRRGDAVWDALQAAEADARLARADRALAALLDRLARHDRRERLRLVVAGGTARDPWSAALDANARGTAPLVTLGLPRMDGVVQERALREALSAVIDEPAAADARLGALDGPLVLARAGETDVAFDCGDVRWRSDVTGDRAVTREGEPAPTAKLDDCVGAPWRPERVSATNGGDDAVKCRVLVEEGATVGGPDGPKRWIEADLAAGASIALRTSRARPAMLVRWTADGVVEADCAVGGASVLATDVATVFDASGDAWTEEDGAPRLDLSGTGAWRVVRVGAAADADAEANADDDSEASTSEASTSEGAANAPAPRAAELVVEAWPPRLEPDADWIDALGDATVAPHSARPGAWVVRGTEPLEVRVLRRAGGELAFAGRLDGDRVTASGVRADGERARRDGSVTILLSAGAWNQPALYGAAPESARCALRLLGAPPTAPVVLPSAEEQRTLIRAARTP